VEPTGRTATAGMIFLRLARVFSWRIQGFIAYLRND
jgi:hypothetical protein